MLAIWGWKTGKGLESFFVASRRAGPILAGLAGSAAGLSAFVFVGGPGLFATVGIASLWLIASAPLTGTLQCLAVGEPILRHIRSRPALTIPGLIAARWGEGWPRGISASILLLGSLATLAVQIKALAILGNTLLPFPGWALAAGVITLTLAYAATGGMQPGLPIEALQGLIMSIIALLLSAIALTRAGGLASATTILVELRPELLDPMASGHGGAYLSLFLLFAVGTCAQPHYLQKFLMLKDRQSLRLLPAVSTAALLTILSIWVGFGLAGGALAARGALHFANADALAPALLRYLENPALLIAALIAILAAVMSTSATLLNLVAAAFSIDFPAAFGRGTASVNLTQARLATLLAAAVAGSLALASGKGVIRLGILGWGLLTAGFLPVMVLGMRRSEISRRAAIAALLGGPTVYFLLEICQSRGFLLKSEPGLSGAAIGFILLTLWKPPGPEEKAEE